MEVIGTFSMSWQDLDDYQKFRRRKLRRRKLRHQKFRRR